MNAQNITEMSGIRELTADDLDHVAGANPAMIGFVVGYLATKLLDDVSPEFKVVDKIKTMVENQKTTQK
jgi:hypothetical protein